VQRTQKLIHDEGYITYIFRIPITRDTNAISV